LTVLPIFPGYFPEPQPLLRVKTPKWMVLGNPLLDIIEKEDEFSANSRKFAENFSWDKTAESWHSLFERA
jgi:hypothetical protein